MKEWADFIKTIVRPFCIIWSWIVVGVCYMTEVQAPEYFLYVVGAVTLEYFGERVIKRIKEL